MGERDVFSIISVGEPAKLIDSFRLVSFVSYRNLKRLFKRGHL